MVQCTKCGSDGEFEIVSISVEDMLICLRVINGFKSYQDIVYIVIIVINNNPVRHNNPPLIDSRTQGDPIVIFSEHYYYDICRIFCKGSGRDVIPRLEALSGKHNQAYLTGIHHILRQIT